MTIATVSTKTKLVKSIIEQSGSGFVSVIFTKKDGSLRTLVHNPKVRKGIKGDSATESGKQAVATRKANHPNLVSVFDSELASKGELATKCWRTIDCETVKQIKVGGEVIKFD